MGTKSKIAIVLFVLQIIPIAGIVIGTSKNFLGALGYAIGFSILMIIGAILMYLDCKDKQTQINQLKKQLNDDTKITQHNTILNKQSVNICQQQDDTEQEDNNEETIIKKYTLECIVKILLTLIAITAFVLIIVAIIAGITNSL